MVRMMKGRCNWVSLDGEQCGGETDAAAYLCRDHGKVMKNTVTFPMAFLALTPFYFYLFTRSVPGAEFAMRIFGVESRIVATWISASAQGIVGLVVGAVIGYWLVMARIRHRRMSVRDSDSTVIGE